MTSSLIREIQMGERAKLRWPTGSVEHAMWADSSYLLYLPLLSICRILASSQIIPRPRSSYTVNYRPVLSSERALQNNKPTTVLKKISRREKS
jgi:hypothetical protein